MKGLLLIIVSMAQMLDIINVASVTIVLPNVMRDVGFHIDQLQWVSSAYALAYGAFLLVGGRLGDLYGHRNVYILGVTWFSIWSIVNGFAKDPIVMSVGRALQGMGAGFTVPSALAIITTTYPAGPERTRALSIFGGTGATGSIIGLLLGGLLGSTIGWRWMFYITGIIGFSLTFLGIVVIPAEKSQGKVEDRRIDIFGVLAFILGIVAVIYYLSESPESGWSSAKTLAPFVIGLVLLVAFVIIEFKIDYPIMPPHIWRSARFVASCATTICLTAAMNGNFYFMSLAFQYILGYGSLKTSVAFLPHGIGAIIVVGILSVVIPKIRSKILIISGWLFLIASGVLVAQLKDTSSYWAIPFPSLILNMIGMAFIWLTCQINSVADAADEDQGVVGAVFNVCIQLGAPIGIAITNIIANNKNPASAVGPELLPGYHAAFYTVTIIAGVGLVVSLLIYPNSDPARPITDAEAAANEVGESAPEGDKEELAETESTISEVKDATAVVGTSLGR
ncbi:major facilitator superfamily domain-containing protein [Mortierella sp. GBAus27b]|nr:major facilitator superfamily domain-containing protein [Mortierella sp. GBAus27b]